MPLTSARPVTENAPHLRRALGRWDLVLLFVVAVANVNVVPVVAASGAVTIWLWLLALTFFFWPQGVAVIELSRLYPGEGGVYRWTKELFGDFHGFISGWRPKRPSASSLDRRSSGRPRWDRW